MQWAVLISTDAQESETRTREASDRYFVEFYFDQVHKNRRQFRYYACLRQALAQVEKWFNKDPEYARERSVTVYPVQTSPQAAFALNSKGRYQKQTNKKSFRDNNADDIYYAAELVAEFEQLQVKKEMVQEAEEDKDGEFNTMTAFSGRQADAIERLTALAKEHGLPHEKIAAAAKISTHCT